LDVPIANIPKTALGALALAASLAACGPRRGVLPPDEERAAALTGVWQAEFRVTAPLIGRKAGGTVAGTLVLMPNRYLSSAGSGIPVPTHYGAYDADFRPFGFDPRPRDRVPTVSAALTENDSVLMSLESGSPNVRFILRGRLEAGVVRGTWRNDMHIAGAAGEFVLRRASMARPDPAASAVATAASAQKTIGTATGPATASPPRAGWTRRARC
jgi:hypothetical protein